MAKRAARVIALALGAIVVVAFTGCEGGHEPTGTTTGPSTSSTPGTTESTPTESTPSETTTHPAPVTQPPPQTPSGCGVERWNIKTMRDPNAQDVSLVPKPATIAELSELPAPHEPTARVAPTETTDYAISGVIEFVKTEADGDRHLVIVDGNGTSMIIEAPNPRCAAGSDVLGQIETVREAVDARFPSDVSNTSAPVSVTGVGFFDRVHGQTGVAANGIELHPLLSIKFLTGTSLRAPAAPPLHLRESHAQD